MKIIIILIPILALLYCLWMLYRNERVFKMRRRILNAMYSCGELSDLLPEYNSISYNRMLFSVKPLRPECWYSASFCDRLRRSSPSTIILPGLPNLEWMTENLSGFGGTKIDGRWYYTWAEAKEAARQLGGGWRLPTQEEFEALCDLGSTWDDKRKGRWFGGNHDTDHKGSLFIPATGYRLNTSGALTGVGAHGRSWCSSPSATGSYDAGFLAFYSSGVYPLYGAARSYALAVRCVRNVK